MLTIDETHRDAAATWRPPSRLALAIADLTLGLTRWPTWWVLAVNDIRQRYRRSALGQFWVTISMAASIVGIGIVFGIIFHQPHAEYIPYVGVSLVAWGLLAALVNELAQSFISSETYLKAYPGPRSAVVYRTIVRNLLIFAHNLLIVPVLLLAFQIPLTPAALLFIPGLALLVLNAVWVGILLGPLCARFRDLPQLVSNVVQLAFFLTPIMFQPSQVDERLWALTNLNPFASFLEIVRGPLLGGVPALHHYALVVSCAVAGFAVAIPFYARFRGRIVYWL
jgi:ABC-type polysaccharide/polyol phosphate export permease